MAKYKTRQNKTNLDGLFPQMFPRDKIGGETNQDEQPSLDEIWEWFGNPDDY